MELTNILLERIANNRKRIVIVGDALTDVWIHGRVENCQDGCPKFVVESRCIVAGGAANAARCLTYWEVNTSLYAWAENDRPIKTRFLFMPPAGLQTERILFRYDDETMVKQNQIEYKWCRCDALEMIHFAGGVLLSDYDKGFMPPEFIRKVIDLCNQLGIPCVADAKRGPEVYAGAVLKGNSDYGHKYNDKVWNRTESGFSLVLTDGPLNPAVWDKGKLQKGFKFQPAVQLVNHVGAGDCFAAHLTLALAYGFPLKDAAVLAHSAGRVYVQFAHNQPPLPTEILEDLAK